MGDDLRFGFFVGGSQAMQDIYKMIERLSLLGSAVLILGETGTGKELVARAIHGQGPRSRQPFVPVDCSAVSASLFETEMFGCVRGAYTGALAGRAGLIESANAGTLFLDEVGNLPLPLQPKMLRALQERQVRPVGAERSRRFTARILAATNRNLEQAVMDGQFRADLFYRLNVVQIQLPPLRQHKEDIPALVAHFTAQYSEETGTRKVVPAEAVLRLQEYDWPGNIRELQNVVSRAVYLEDKAALQFLDFPCIERVVA